MNINGPRVSVVPVSAAINSRGEQHSLQASFCPEFEVSPVQYESALRTSSRPASQHRSAFERLTVTRMGFRDCREKGLGMMPELNLPSSLMTLDRLI